MSMNAMADIALGLILMYLVLSLICTVINESIASMIKLRAKTLGKAITKIIDDKDLLKNFNDHGLISGLRNVLGGRDPSYISGATFATALLDSFNKQRSLVALSATGALNVAGTANAVGAAIKALPDDSNIKDILLGVLPASGTGSLPAGAAGALPTGGINLDDMRKNLATWFDQTMERVSGDYKRWLQIISFLVGLSLACVLNADSWTVASALWSDSALRGQMASAALQVADTNKSLPAEKRAKEFAENISALQTALRPLPIGWPEFSAHPDYSWSKNALGYFEKILGLLFTALAIMLGAPFWFDLLSKFVQLRNSGAPPQPPKPATVTLLVSGQG